MSSTASANRATDRGQGVEIQGPGAAVFVPVSGAVGDPHKSGRCSKGKACVELIRVSLPGEENNMARTKQRTAILVRFAISLAALALRPCLRNAGLRLHGWVDALSFLE